MKYFYDTEFLDDGASIDLISIGIVAEDGREYYAVSSDMPLDRIKDNDWLVRNVLPHLPLVERQQLDTYLRTPPNAYRSTFTLDRVDLDRSDLRVKPRWVIANEVREFLLAANADRDWRQVELWAYYGAYDHVALAQLWGPMVRLPKGIPMWTNDIMQLADGRPLPEQKSDRHDALADARHVKAMWEHLAGQAVTS
ncbi:MAG TPA: 3'-5' exoribonuclease [Micromonosporaceae bacterium]